MKVQGWETYDGRRITMNEISHQHLSNIYYYTHFTMAQYYPQWVREDIVEWLKIRFGGVILPYKPVNEFEFERKRLATLGFLRPNGEIVVYGKKLGAYV
jgi:hypothetical protein